MSVRNLLPIALVLAVVSAGCAGAPTQAEGTVSVTQTTSTTTSTSTTTTTIPQLTAGSIGTSPSGAGLAFATVYTFLFVNAPTGGVPPFTFAWNFGDGGAGAGAAPTHAYLSNGNFTATATTTDTRGISVVASGSVAIRLATGRWTATVTGVANPEPIDIIQNATALIATINSANALGFASGSGSVSNPRSMSISATYGVGGPAPFAATYVGRLDDTLMSWTGTVTGYAGCPCLFTATRVPAAGDLSLPR